MGATGFIVFIQIILESLMLAILGETFGYPTSATVRVATDTISTCGEYA